MLIQIRDFFISNFNIQIYGIIYNNNIYYLNGIYPFIPFYIIKIITKILHIFIIYMKDNIYYSTKSDNQPISILPLILKFKINEIELKFKLKYYNLFIPINFFISHNNFDVQHSILNIKYLKKQKIYEKILTFTNFNNKMIYELFLD